MRTKHLPILLSFLLIATFAKGQFGDKGELRGNLADSTAAKYIEHASVMLLRPADSVLLKFVRSNSLGAFRFKNLDTGNYLIIITHPTFADYTEIVKVEAGDVTKLNTYMIQKTVALKEFIFKQKKGAIVFKGDTIEYTADSFKTKEFATVEDLLKKLPGIQVDKNGVITAHGEKVDKVLVDGEEFFSDDPTVATKNLQAITVDKVQVYDKENAQSQATGISDGKKEKVLNLKLKEEYKKGMFGKVKASGGLPKWYENEAMINAFKSKRKLSGYIIHSNTNRNSLDWEEQQSFGSNSNVSYSDDGSTTFYSNGSSQEISNNNQGQPSNLSMGGHFSDKFKGDKHHLSLNLTSNSQIRRGVASSTTRQLLADSSFYNVQSDSFVSKGIKSNFDLSYTLKPDSFATLTITANMGTLMLSKVDSFASVSLNDDEVFVNQSIRSTADDRNKNSYGGGLNYQRKFRKKDRLLYIVVGLNGSAEAQTGKLLSKNILGLKKDTSAIDQKKDNNKWLSNASFTSSFTEPITKYLNLQVSYSYVNNQNSNTNNSYNSDGVSYNILDPKYSNDFKFNIITQSPGLTLKYKRKKWSLNAGANLQANNYIRTNRTIDSTVHYNFTNFQRMARYEYKFSQFNGFKLSYNGYTQQPSITQIQPLQNNLDPFNIQKGNENLKPQVTNTFRIESHSYKMINDRSAHISMGYNNTYNAFTSFDVIDEFGQRISQTINVARGNYSFWSWMYYGFKLKKSGVKLKFSSNPSVNNYINYINGIKNQTLSSSIDISPGLDYEKEDKYEVSFDFNFDYNSSRSSLNPDRKTQYWIQSHDIELTVFLPRKLELTTDFSANIRQKTSDFTTNNNMFIWNMSVERKMFKKENFKLSFIVRDILNQNTGFSRSVSSNYLTESRYNVIKRYWLVSILWNFNKTAKAPNNGEVEDAK
ncbi:MAG: TonB-dependent receptor [Bacteroidota bacterium]|nr:TonB-dependent receptor [Bacteroidota bacterium]